MALLYKHFAPVHTVFYIIFPVFVMLVAVTAHAADPLFTVSDVKVDVTAENALAAREQAFEQAQRDAFEIMAARMLSESAAATFELPETNIISRMIQDYEITNEKLSAVRYIGTYTFRFYDSAVRRFFGKRGVEYTDVSQKPLLILPFYEYNGRNIIWSPYNQWIQAWNRARNLEGLVTIIVPLGDLQDVQDIGDNEALDYSRIGLSNLLNRYKASEAVIAIAVPDYALNEAAINEPVTGGISIRLYRTDRGAPEFVTALEVEPQDGMPVTKAALFDLAVMKVQKALRQDWKNRTMVQPSSRTTYKVDVPLRNLAHWSSVQKTLGRIRSIENLTLHALTPKKAEIEFAFSGSLERLSLVLDQAGLAIIPEQMVPGYTGGYQDSPGMQPKYNLYLKEHLKNQPENYTADF